MKAFTDANVVADIKSGFMTEQEKRTSSLVAVKKQETRLRRKLKSEKQKKSKCV